MNKHLLKKIRRLLALCMKDHKVPIIAAVLLTLAGSILGALNPYIIGLAITELAKNVKDMQQGSPGAGINNQYILFTVSLLAVSAIVRQSFTYFASFLLAGGVQNSFRTLRTEINRKMNTLPVSFFDSHQQGSLLSVVTTDVDTISNAMQQSLLPIVYSVISIVTTFVMILFISLPLGIVSLLLIPAAFFLSRFVSRRSQGEFFKMQNTVAELNGYIQERYSGFTAIKLYNNENNTIEHFQEINGRLNKAAFTANFMSSLLSPLMELLINISYVIMILLAGWAVLFSGMALGNMQAVVQYIWQVYEPMGQLTQLFPAVQSAVASAERIVDFLEQPEESDESHKPATIDARAYDGEVVFDHASFAYSKSKPLIKDFSLVTKPGQKIAIVGATGAGKTTIINLLMRFYDVGSGDIRIDGDSIYDMRRENGRQLFGMVLQDAWLYHATIRDNIRFSRLNATDEEIIKAAKDANVHHFIKTMPGGYDMMINEDGDNVSQGQKQLLTIARALLADPCILILDEATSSVDTRLEMLIQLAMKHAMEGRTSFVIAHRLSTIRDADLILVMEQGDIVERGSHEELLLQKGIYERLYNSQFAQ